MENGKDDTQHMKWVGAVLVIVGCGSYGFLIASQYLYDINIHHNLVGILEFMSNELQYRCTPLPQLCHLCAQQAPGRISKLFKSLAYELDSQISPNVELCMVAALEKSDIQNQYLYQLFLELGKNLGKFDLYGQLNGLVYIKEKCLKKLDDLQRGKEARIRSYQTLGLCTGAAIAILLV